MQLNIVALSESFTNVLIPFVSQRFQFRMFAFELSKPDLLHQVGKKGCANIVLSINLEQRAQRRELNLLDVARAVTAQFPVMS